MLTHIGATLDWNFLISVADSLQITMSFEFQVNNKNTIESNTSSSTLLYGQNELMQLSNNNDKTLA